MVGEGPSFFLETLSPKSIEKGLNLPMFKMPRIVVSALSPRLSYNIRLAITLFSRIFIGEGTIGYMVCEIVQFTKVKGLSTEQGPDWHLAKLRWRRGVEVHVLYCDGS